MKRRPPRSTRKYTHGPETTLFRSLRAKTVVYYSEDRLTLQCGQHGFRALLCRTANKSNMALFGAFGIFQMPNQNRVLVDMLAACRLVEPGAERIAADNAKLAGITVGRAQG